MAAEREAPRLLKHTTEGDHEGPQIASSSPFFRSDPRRLPDNEQLAKVLEDFMRSELPGPPPKLPAMDHRHRLVMECLDLYNSKHPGDEYVPAPGVVTRYSGPGKGACWTHGNFVARPKRSGWFSFLPAPRTLFFYELVCKDGFDGVVSCSRLDEPVTEAYTLLGFRLGWGTRRDGGADCRCKTCDRLVDRPLAFVGKTFPCGHTKAECVCELYHIRSEVQHPLPGEFEFSNSRD